MTLPFALDFSPVLFWLLAAPAAFLVAMAATGFMIARMMPLLARYALARPNARSSHTVPTPQGGGIAVVGSTLVVSAFGALMLPASEPITPWPFAALVAATAALAVIGAIDDIRSMPIAPRLILQVGAVAMVVVALPRDLTIMPALPLWLERATLILAGAWLVNLVNFMDGIDWMMTAEMIPVAGGIALIGAVTGLSPVAIVVALALCGAMIGFAPFNRPVARLFLGDVGSLPIGLLLGWLLVLLAANGQVVTAVILPLYFAADATLTLLRRVVRGERIWEAHRSHFYQRATGNGWSVSAVVARVFAVNLTLVALALIASLAGSRMVDLGALVLAAALVGWLLTTFSARRRIS